MISVRKVNQSAKGLYIPKNPEKYMGDLSKITFRSSWERRMMEFFDLNPNVERWCSEEIAIPYIKPTDGAVHKYYPDFYVEYKDRNGAAHRELIEIKPHKQAVYKQKSSDYDKISFAINMAKWESAKQFCDKQGIKFRVLTEQQLFPKEKK